MPFPKIIHYANFRFQQLGTYNDYGALFSCLILPLLSILLNNAAKHSLLLCRQEYVFAQKGFGASLNDKKISVSKKTEVLHSCLVTGFPYTYLDMENGPLEVFERLVRKGVPVRRLGSAAIDLCWVAAGRFEGFFEHSLSAWDSAAGYLIVEEAGGKVTDMNGDKYSPYQRKIVATNGLIHDELIEVIHNRKQL